MAELKDVKKDYSFGVVLFRKEGGKTLILLVREHADSGVAEERGTWGLPKGHKDGDESDIEAARRELLEETGITNCDFYPSTFWKISYPVSKNGDNFDKTVTYFLASTEESVLRPAPGEIAECKWLTLDEAETMVTFDGIRTIIMKAREKLQEAVD